MGEACRKVAIYIIPVDALSNQGATSDQVRNIVDQLVSDGHLYSTVDDDHFKATS